MQRSQLVRLGAAVLAATAIAAPRAHASVFTPGPLTEASATNPLAACPPDAAGVNFAGAEVEPFLGVNPTDDDNLVGVYQQDRYSNGGSKGSVAASSLDGGATWVDTAIPTNTRCTGGRYQRASDPWVSFGPDGVAHAMSLVTDPDPASGGFGANGMVYNRSTDGGRTWGPPIMLIEDAAGRYLNDKNSLTADPNDANYVYAIWDRLQEAGRAVANPENQRGGAFKGPIMLARSTDGGDSFEAPRKIYESGANKQTIGYQIVVRPQGELVDVFGDITNNSNRRQSIGPVNVSTIVSDDRGSTWSKPARIDDQLPMALFRAASTVDLEPVPCPDPASTGACPIRGGELIPEAAVNRGNGRLYVVWMDARFSYFQTGSFQWDSVAFSQSTDGGRTWSPAIQVNRTPAGSRQNSQAFTPSVHVSDDGTVTVSYYDFRDNTASPTSLDTTHWAVHCHAASENCANAASWDEETQVSPTFDIREAAFARGYFLGDYMGLDSDGSGAVLSLFGSTAGGGPSSIFLRRLLP
jgi:hypothetical protein